MCTDDHATPKTNHNKVSPFGHGRRSHGPSDMIPRCPHGTNSPEIPSTKCCQHETNVCVPYPISTWLQPRVAPKPTLRKDK